MTQETINELMKAASLEASNASAGEIIRDAIQTGTQFSDSSFPVDMAQETAALRDKSSTHNVIKEIAASLVGLAPKDVSHDACGTLHTIPGARPALRFRTGQRAGMPV